MAGLHGYVDELDLDGIDRIMNVDLYVPVVVLCSCPCLSVASFNFKLACAFSDMEEIARRQMTL